MIYKNLNIILLNILLIVLSSCRNGETESEQITTDEELQTSEINSEGKETAEEDLVSTINGRTELSRFAMELGMVEIPQLDLENEIYTIFAPENGIFNSRYGESEKKIRKVNTSDLIAYHIVEGEIGTEEMREKTDDNNEWLLKSINGEDLTIISENNEIYLKGVSGEKARILRSANASNGILYVIDEVLFPPEKDQ